MVKQPRRQKYFVTVWACFAVIFVFLCGIVRAQERKLQPLNVSHSAQVASRVHLWMARDLGIFAKHGLDVNIIYIAGGPTSLQAMLGGNVQIVTAGGQATVAAAARGAPLVIFGLSNITLYVLVSNPSITTVEGLKGKVIGTSRPAAAADFTLRLLLAKLGLDPNKNVTVRPTGLSVSRDRVVLMTQGQIDATLASVDDVIEFQMRGHKFNILADSVEMGVISSEDFTATREFLSTSPATAAAFLKATSEAVWLAKKDRDLTSKFFRKYLGREEPWILETLHKYSVLKGLPDKPYPRLDVIDQYIEFLTPTTPNLIGKKAADFANSDIVTAIDKEGFWEQLKKR